MVKVKQLRKKSSEKSYKDYSFEERYELFQEMISVLGLTDTDKETGEEIDVYIADDITEEELDVKIAEAIELIRPAEDEFTNPSQEMINAYKRMEIARKEEKGEEIKETDIPEEDRVESILEAIQDAETLKELREIAGKYRLFNAVNLKIKGYKMKEDLRDDLLRALVPPVTNIPEEAEEVIEQDEEDQQTKANKLHKKLKAPKKENKVVEESPQEEPEEEKKPKRVILPKKQPAAKKVKKEKPVKKDDGKYTRTRAVAETMKNNPDSSVDDIIKWADDLFVENGGQTNIRHSRVQYNIIKQVLEIFEVL